MAYLLTGIAPNWGTMGIKGYGGGEHELLAGAVDGLVDAVPFLPETVAASVTGATTAVTASNTAASAGTVGPISSVCGR